MSVVVDSIRFVLYDFWQQHADERVAHYWLAQNGLVNVLLILASYIALVKVIVPRVMANRAPYSLRHAMVLYNLTMSSVNLYFVVHCFVLSDFGREWFTLVAPSPKDTSPRQLQIIYVVHLCMLTKFVDLLETVFFVLRKKQSQLTFLHLYHHSLVPLLAVISFYLHPSAAPNRIFICFNSTVHTFMYAYYGLSAMGPSMARHLWWKKYITQLQIVQFIVYIAFCALYAKYSQGYSMAYMWIGISQAPLFAFLFIKFYFRSYIHKNASLKVKDALKIN